MATIPNHVGVPDLQDSDEASGTPSVNGLWAKAFDAVAIAADADRRDIRDKAPAPHVEYVGRPSFCSGANLASFITVEGVEQCVWTRRRCGDKPAPGIGRCTDCVAAERNNRADLRERMKRHTQTHEPAKRRGF